MTKANAPHEQTTSADSADCEVVSPELALVSPELRALAIAALPPIEPASPTPLPQRIPPEQSVRAVITHVAWIGALAFAAVVIVVLSLTVVANALR